MSRFSCAWVAIATWVTGCECGEGPEVDDASIDASWDASFGDAGAIDASNEDTGSDAGDDGTCRPDPAGAEVLVPGFRVETLAEGEPLLDPVGLAFGFDGRLYVANSHSWLTTSMEPGEILRLEDNGTLSTYFTDDRLRGPGFIAFLESETGGPGVLYAGTEDVKETRMHPSDWMLVYDGASAMVGADTYENSGVAFGPGGAWGTGLYYTGRSNVEGGVPNPGRLHRIGESGSAIVELRAEDDTAPGAAAVFDFGRGGSFGEDLYLATVEDDPSYTPDSSYAIWRADAEGNAVVLVPRVRTTGLVTPRDPEGPFGDYLYAAIVDNAGNGTIHRIDASGEMTEFVTRLAYTGGIIYGPDGALYFTETATQRIRRITVCIP
jgi:hypothetical protein